MRKEDRWVAEQISAEGYTRLWHEALDVATGLATNIAGRRPTYPRQPPARIEQIQIVRAALAPRWQSARDALRHGWPPEALLDALPPAKAVPHVGHRRSLVRGFCWTVDEEDQRAYDGQWITLIPSYAPDAATMRRAVANAAMWLQGYVDNLHQMTASRMLVFTSIEIVFWVQGPYAKYL